MNEDARDASGERTPVAPAGAATAPSEQPTGSDGRVLIEPPSHVQRVKHVVGALSRRAPWLRSALGPAYTWMSGRYYRWVNRHERVEPAEAIRRTHARGLPPPPAALVGKRVMVQVPDRVATAKRVVNWVGLRAPWLRSALGPLRKPISGAFYHWVARHEWVNADASPMPAAEFPVELLDAAIAKARAEAATREPWRGRADRTLHVIGTLGAGGSERQLVLLVEGIATRRIGRPGVVTNIPLTGAAAHFAPRVSAVAELDRFRHRGDRAARMWLRGEGIEAADRIPVDFASELEAARRCFRKRKPAVVHLWLDWNCAVTALAALLEPIPRIVLSTRSVNPTNFPILDRPYYRALYRYVLADPRVVMCNNSEVGAADYAQWLDVPRSRIVVVHNGLDAETVTRPPERELAALRAKIELPPGAPVLVGVLRLSEEKRPLVFVDAAERVLAARSDAIAVLVGDGPLRQEVDARVAASPHRKRFRILGRRDDAHSIIALADVLLLTSRMEGSPNVLLEAQAMGCVPVSTRAGGAIDVLPDGTAGFVVDVDDAEALAERAERIFADPKLKARLADGGQRNVRERFGIERMIDETLALYG